MKASKWILVSLVVGFCAPVFAGSADNIYVSHYETLQRLSSQDKGAAANQKLAIAGQQLLSFDALGQSFELILRSNSGFLSSDAVKALPAGIGIYRGSLAGNADSWVRIVMFEGSPRGFIWDGAEMYAIEAPGDSAVQSSSAIIYRLSDVTIEAGSMSCGSESLSGKASETYSKLVGEIGMAAQQAPGAVSEIDIGAVGDFEFTSSMGDDAAAAVAILDRMNRVDGIFSQEIGIQINVPFIETFSDPDVDPFSDTLDPGALLDDVVTYRGNTSAQNDLGLTHLWTGRDLEGTTVGIAYSNVLCRNSFGSGLSMGSGSAAFGSLVAAHEIGHNFGAPHDGVDGACVDEPQTFLMAPRINDSNQFSQCSKTIMEANAARASCVTALPTVDMAVALNSTPANILLGASTDLVFDVQNSGSLAASNVAAEFVIPANLTINSVATTIGTCTDGAGTVSCTIGDVLGLSDNTVTVVTTPSSVGTGLITASISADFDQRLANNQDAMQVTVDPAVDLSINSLPAVSVNLASAANIVVTVQNLSIVDATTVTMSMTLGGRVRADSATLSIGSCTVAAQQIDCQATDFTNLSSATLRIGVTGVTAGRQDYSVSVSSSEADANPSSNDATGSITIRDPADDDSSSAGAVSLPLLFLLSLLAIAARRLPWLRNESSQRL